MHYISRPAARTFLALTRASHFGSLISWTEALGRIAALRTLCELGSPEALEAQRILVLDGWEAEDKWDGGDSGATTNVAPRSGRLQFPSGDDEPNVIYLFPNVETGLSDWEFHQADDDFFPSIPHGHHRGRKQPKLDPYQGWIYRGTEQVKRAPRESIILLWNDYKFRKFAAAAIDYYLSEHPHYAGWRVSDPRRLPRRR